MYCVGWGATAPKRFPNEPCKWRLRNETQPTRAFVGFDYPALSRLWRLRSTQPTIILNPSVLSYNSDLKKKKIGFSDH